MTYRDCGCQCHSNEAKPLRWWHRVFSPATFMWAIGFSAFFFVAFGEYRNGLRDGRATLAADGQCHDSASVVRVGEPMTCPAGAKVTATQVDKYSGSDYAIATCACPKAEAKAAASLSGGLSGQVLMASPNDVVRWAPAPWAVKP